MRPTRHDLKPLLCEALSRRVLGQPRTPQMREAPKQMSLAGVQHKRMAILIGLDVYMSLGSTPLSHILKPDRPGVASQLVGSLAGSLPSGTRREGVRLLTETREMQFPPPERQQLLSALA